MSRRRRTGRRAPVRPAAVWGRDDLVCPVGADIIARMHGHAAAHPWPGNTTLTCPGHLLDTTAITEPGRPVRLLYSLDFGYHASGWFANSLYEQCLHLSLSHPVPGRSRIYVPRVVGRPVGGVDLETPADDEARAWARVFWGEHATKAWFEPAASMFDPYRAPNVVHLRLYLDQDGRPILPEGEPYDLRPFADGSSPAKVTDGRLGADVR